MDFALNDVGFGFYKVLYIVSDWSGPNFDIYNGRMALISKVTLQYPTFVMLSLPFYSSSFLVMHVGSKTLLLIDEMTHNMQFCTV